MFGSNEQDIAKWMNTAIPALEGKNQLNYCIKRVVSIFSWIA
jgi:hypothetical protein